MRQASGQRSMTQTSKNIVLLCLKTLMKLWKLFELKKNHLLMTKSSPSRYLLNLKVLPTSKALKLYTTLSSTSTTNCLALMFKRKVEKCMMNCDDCLRRFSETLTLNVKRKKFMHSRQMTMHDVFKQ